MIETTTFNFIPFTVWSIDTTSFPRYKVIVTSDAGVTYELIIQALYCPKVGDTWQLGFDPDNNLRSSKPGMYESYSLLK